MFSYFIFLGLISAAQSYVQEIKCVNDYSAIDGGRSELTIARNEDGSYKISRYTPAGGRPERPEVNETLVSKAVCVFAASDERIFNCDSFGKPQTGDVLGRVSSDRHIVRGVIRGVDQDHRMVAQSDLQEYLNVSIFSAGIASEIRYDIERGSKGPTMSFCRVKFTVE